MTKLIVAFLNFGDATNNMVVGSVTAGLVHGDSLARDPKLLFIKNYVNQLTDDKLTTGYYQQDGATYHTSNASMREIESFFPR